MSLWKKPPSLKDGMVAVIDAPATTLCLSAGRGRQPGTVHLAGWRGTCLLHLMAPAQPAVAVLGLVWLLDRMLCQWWLLAGETEKLLKLRTGRQGVPVQRSHGSERRQQGA
jgi:hypothetical protein